MMQLEQNTVGSIQVPRNSVTTFLTKFARHPVLHDFHKNPDNRPYCFVTPPEAHTGSFQGWLMLEWTFYHNHNKVRYQAYLNFNPDPKQNSEVFMVLDENWTPTEPQHCKMMVETDFINAIGEYFKDKGQDLSGTRQVRMGSRHTHHSDFESKFPYFQPSDYKITSDEEKLMCQLTLSAFDTMVYEDEDQVEAAIVELDQILAPVYMPFSADQSFEPKLM